MRDTWWAVGTTVLGLQGAQPLWGTGGDGCEWRRLGEMGVSGGGLLNCFFLPC